MLPADSIPAMIDEITATINEKHPFSFRPEGVEALEAARTQVQGEVEKAVKGRDFIPYHEFTALAAPIQEVTQCGHLILEPYVDSIADVSLRENYFPLNLTPTAEGDVFMLHRGLRTTTDSLPAGTFVLALDGIPTPTLIDRLAPFGGVNDQGNNGAARALAARAIAFRYQQYYGLQDSIVLQLDENHFTPSTRVIYPRHRPYVDPKKAVTDINKTLQFELSDNGQAGILTIKSFASRKFNNGNYHKYIRGVMDSLNAGGIRNLVIDIRGNTGGNSNRIMDLFSYLSPGKFRFADRAEFTGPARAEADESAKDSKRREAGAVSRRARRLQKRLTQNAKPQKADRQFTGKVAVLIDEISFSASGMFARYVQGSERGILVGSTSGASANITYGASQDKDKTLIGPNDDFRLRVNTILLELPNPIPGNVTPDIQVRPSSEDLENGKDPVLEAALQAMLKEGI